jgi:uncharacterized protein YegL
MSRALYEKVVKVSDVYLGPAADRFITRQITNHLRKQPEQLTEADLTKLIDWIRLTVSLITEDEDIVDEYVSQLEKLSAAPQKQSSGNGE